MTIYLKDLSSGKSSLKNRALPKNKISRSIPHKIDILHPLLPEIKGVPLLLIFDVYRQQASQIRKNGKENIMRSAKKGDRVDMGVLMPA